MVSRSPKKPEVVIISLALGDKVSSRTPAFSWVIGECSVEGYVQNILLLGDY